MKIAQAMKIEGHEIVVIIMTNGDIWRVALHGEGTFRIERMMSNTLLLIPDKEQLRANSTQPSV